MSEKFPSNPNVDLPVSEDVPLAYLEQGEEYPRALYQFDTPDLQDRYVVRSMGFDDPAAYDQLPLTEQYAAYDEELRSLQDAGVNVPRTYTTTPEGFENIVPESPTDRKFPDVMVVTEKIDPVDMSVVDPNVIRQQAQAHIEGLIHYLQKSHDPNTAGSTPYYMGDVFKPTEVLYGQPHTGGEPGFYMIDTGGLMHRSDIESDFGDDLANIMATGVQLSRMTGDPSVEAYTMDRLGMTEEQADAAVRSYYYSTENPDFEDYA